MYTGYLKGESFFFGLAVGERRKRHVLILGASDRINSVANRVLSSSVYFSVPQGLCCIDLRGMWSAGHEFDMLVSDPS